MSELEEKFVSDDQVSEVPDPVTPEGGKKKKKPADKANPPMQDMEKVSEESEASEEVIEEEVIEVEESISAMFEGMDLSEDFKSKVTLVFEAAVNEATKVRVDEATTTLEEEFETKLTESVNEAMEGIVENLDSYLDYVVNEWVEENRLSIESGIKVEMAESLMVGLQELFAEHNIDIDDEKVNVVSGLEEEIDNLQAKANETINENIELAKQVAALKADKVFDEISEDLTVSQQERLKVLSEKLDNEDLDAYKSDLATLKESFFKTAKPQVISEDADQEEEIITEETAVKAPVSEYTSVAAIVEALNAKSK